VLHLVIRDEHRDGSVLDGLAEQCRLNQVVDVDAHRRGKHTA